MPDEPEGAEACARIPSPPPHLSDRAKTAWGYVGGLLDHMGMVTEEMRLGSRDCASAIRSWWRPAKPPGTRATTYESVNGGGGTMYQAYPEVALVADADRRFRVGSKRSD